MQPWKGTGTRVLPVQTSTAAGRTPDGAAAGVPWATQRGGALLGSVLCLFVWVFVCFLLSPPDQN